MAVRPPDETGLGAVKGRWRPPPAAGWREGMPRMSGGLSTDGVGETAEVGEPAEGNEEVVVVSALPVLRVSWDLLVEVCHSGTREDEGRRPRAG